MIIYWFLISVGLLGLKPYIFYGCPLFLMNLINIILVKQNIFASFINIDWIFYGIKKFWSVNYPELFKLNMKIRQKVCES